MPRPRLKTILDFTDRANRQRVMQWIGGVTSGWYEITIVPRRVTKTIAQLGFYYGVVVEEFRRYARDQGNDWTASQCHEYLKSLFLTEPLVNKTTGEIECEVPRSLADCSLDEMACYLDQCIAWLATEHNVIVPPPDPSAEPATLRSAWRSK